MKTVYLLLLVALFAVFSLPSQAAQFSGSYLLQVCEKDERGRETTSGGHSVCQSYISGVIDYHNVLRSLRIAPQVNICVPESITLNDVHDVVLAYLRAHNEHDDFVAAPAVTMALYEVFPCKK